MEEALNHQGGTMPYRRMLVVVLLAMLMSLRAAHAADLSREPLVPPIRFIVRPLSYLPTLHVPDTTFHFNVRTPHVAPRPTVSFSVLPVPDPGHTYDPGTMYAVGFTIHFPTGRITLPPLRSRRFDMPSHE